MTLQNSGSGNLWKTGLIVMAAIFIAAMAASLVIAKRKVSRVVDDDYYSHGLHYAETHVSEGKSWTMTTAVDGRQLQAVVRDSEGAPVAGGRMVYAPDRHKGNRGAEQLSFMESSPGTYRALLPDDSKSELHGTMHFTRGEATVVNKVVVIN